MSAVKSSTRDTAIITERFLMYGGSRRVGCSRNSTVFLQFSMASGTSLQNSWVSGSSGISVMTCSKKGMASASMFSPMRVYPLRHHQFGSSLPSSAVSASMLSARLSRSSGLSSLSVYPLRIMPARFDSVRACSPTILYVRSSSGRSSIIRTTSSSRSSSHIC